jgi:hypothetical protein
MHYYLELQKLINEEAEKLDISAIPSKAEELHRLFDSARDSIVALLVFARKAGVMLEDQYLPITLNSLLRDGDGKRTINTWWNGRLVSIDVDKLDTANASRLALAEQHGVSEQIFLRYEQRIAGQYGTYVHIPCNHRGCSISKNIGFRNPIEMLEAERRASNELWYCHHHREEAFLQEGALPDDLFPVLERISYSPGLTQKNTGAKRDDIQFLESVGLVTVEKVTHGTRLLCYQITLTDDGQRVLDRSMG